MHPLHTSYALTAWPRDSHLAHLGYPRARKYLDRTSEALQSIQSHCRIVASFGAMCDNNVTVLQPGHSVTYLSQYHSVSVMISYDTISHSHLHPLSRIILMCNNLGTHREQPCSYFVLQPWNKPETNHEQEQKGNKGGTKVEQRWNRNKKGTKREPPALFSFLICSLRPFRGVF